MLDFSARSEVTLPVLEIFVLYENLVKWEDLLSSQFTNVVPTGDQGTFNYGLTRTSDTVARFMTVNGASTGTNTYFLQSDSVVASARDAASLSWADYKIFAKLTSAFESQIKDMRFNQ